ncbi:winged helix-turn-helix domain-containing protein, partial [Phocaeicola dorei]|uniref:winged helix-turn-helix domain-containing protein n=1 Tax=Phocaeicola dorei TaxID=357276 RepID=UPI001D086A0E
KATTKPQSVKGAFLRMLTVRRDVILSRLWDTEDDFFASRSLDVFVTRLRKLFADDERIQIKTVKGVGLCLSDKG